MVQRVVSRIADWTREGCVRFQSFRARITERARGEQGAIAIEYILIMALIAAIIIALFLVILWPNLEGPLNELKDRILSAINGEGIAKPGE